jgi:hypothetical protein
MTHDSPERQRADRLEIDEWSTLSDELLQGLVHALNNRVAALSAFVELTRFGDEDADPLVVLPAELAQLHRVNSLFGLLPARGSEPEALELPLVLDDALRVHEHHPRLRFERCAVVREGTPLPVRAPRWALFRALLMLVHAAKRAGAAPPAKDEAPLRVVGDATLVSVRVATEAEPSAYLQQLAERCGGQCTQDGGELVFVLPSILELRRRERAARVGESEPNERLA